MATGNEASAFGQGNKWDDGPIVQRVRWNFSRGHRCYCTLQLGREIRTPINFGAPEGRLGVDCGS